MIIQAFFEGIITALGALVLELSVLAIFNLNSAESSLITLFICVILEEIMKYAIIYNHYLKSKYREKIIYSAIFIGLGFSAMELFLKQLDYQKTITLPILGIFLIHMITSSIVGFFLWKKCTQTTITATILIILNTLIHFFYNFIILNYS